MWRVRKQEDLYVFLDEDAKDIEIGYGMFIEEKDLEQLKTMQIRFRTEEERIRRKEEINKLLIEAKEKAQKLGEQYQNYW